MSGRAHAALFGWPDVATTIAPGGGGLCVFGAPFEFGNPIRKGAARAPAAIRHAGMAMGAVRCAGIDIGDLERGDDLDPMRCLSTLSRHVAGIRAQGRCPLMLGGDHALSFGPISAVLDEGDLCVIWFDAHTDFSEWSGPATHDHKQVLRRIAALPGVRRVVQVGYRGITTADERRMGDRATVLTSAAAAALAPDDLLALIPDDLPCYVSIDIDAIDPLHAPGTGAPVPDGLAPHTLEAWLAAIVARRRVVGIDLVEVNPALDHGGETLAVAAGLLRAIAEHWPSGAHAATTHGPESHPFHSTAPAAGMA